MDKQPPTKSKTAALEAGQWWQTKECYIQISRVGKTLTEYKLLRKPGQRGVQPQMGTTKSVLAYLKTNKARQIARPQPPTPSA